MNDPNSIVVKIASSIPFIKKYQKFPSIAAVNESIEILKEYANNNILSAKERADLHKRIEKLEEDRKDMKIPEENLTIFRNSISIGQLHFTVTNGLDLGAPKLHAGLDRGRDVVVVPGFAVTNHDLDFLSILLHQNRIAPAE